MFQNVMSNNYAKSYNKKVSASIEFIAALIALTSGLLLMLIGLILSAVSFVSHARFRSWDVISLAMSFGLLAIGSHFLDKADAAEKSAKIEHCKQHQSAGEQFG